MLSVGGLWDLALIPETSFLFVVSAQGRSVLDLTTGERVARDRSEDYPTWLHPDAPLARGIGALGSDWVEVFGLHGGNARQQTDDGWTALKRGDDVVLTNSEREQLVPAGVVEVRAFAFSNDDQHFVMGTAADLIILTRENT